MAISTIGTDALASAAVTSAKIASGQTPSFNGISFPATQVASSDANTLDDYEEGTWTPSCQSGSGSLTSYTSGARYTKIGRLVNVVGYVTITNGGAAGGSLMITNLPFVVANTSTQPTGVSRDSGVNGQVYSAFINDGNNYLYIQALTGSAASWTTNTCYNFNMMYAT